MVRQALGLPPKHILHLKSVLIEACVAAELGDDNWRMVIKRAKNSTHGAQRRILTQLEHESKTTIQRAADALVS
jgi:hypothetical protein